MSTFRVAVTDEQFGAVLEAARQAADDDLWLTKQLIILALSIKNSVDSDWQWRMEDEA